MKDNASRQRILRTLRLSMIGMLWILALAAVWKTWSRLPTSAPASSPDTASTNSPLAIDPKGDPHKPAQLPEFSLVNCDGRDVSRVDLLGRPVVISFIFTQCTSTCPAITRQMVELQDRLSDTDTLFVTITVDPKRDTPQVLKQYAKGHSADLARWLFLTGEPDAIYALINDGFGLAAKELFGEQRQPGLEVAHTNRVVLIDRDGQVQSTYLATESEDMVRLRRKLKQLTGTDHNDAPQPETSATSDSSVPRESQGCQPLADLASDEAEQPASEQPPAEQPAADPPSALPNWPLQGIADFQLQECNGRSVTRADLLGHQSVVCFVFTRCAGPCPQVSLQMRELQDRLESLTRLSAFPMPLPLGGALGGLLSDSVILSDRIALDRIPEFRGNRVRLITITVDPQHDTPEVLQNYAETFGADPDRWWFLTGEQQAIYDLTNQSFQQIVQELTGEDRRPGYEVIHTTNLLHLDALGRVRGKYNSQTDADMTQLRRALTTGRSRPDRDPVLAQASAGNSVEPTAGADEPAAGSEEPPVANGLRPQFPPQVPEWVRALPRVNALLNATATVLLLLGFVWIRRGHRGRHQWAMLTAFATSIVFLGCYATYHVALRHYTGSGSIRFLGTGWIRPVYYTILLTHVVLAAAVPVLASMTIWRAIHERWDAHRKIARITFPIWVYVSVTGVMIYAMLYHWPVAA